MPTVFDYRRQNLRKLANKFGGVKLLAEKLGYTNSSFIVQMAGPNPIRQVSESTARKFEKHLDLIPGFLDNPVEIDSGDLVDPGTISGRQANFYRKAKGLDPVPPAQAPVNRPEPFSAESLAELVSFVGQLCGESGVNLSTQKFSNVVSLALLTRGTELNKNNEDYIRALVSLAK